MSQLNPGSSTYFESLRARIRAESDRGHLQTALDLCQEAIVWAEASGDRDALDLALCNRGGILVAQDKGDEVVSQLRRILLASRSPLNCSLAAHNLSRFHQLRHETERGLFYAHLCLGHAEKTGRPDLVAAGHHQIGNLQLIDCAFEEACQSYEQALRLYPPQPCTHHAITFFNIGYCYVVLRHHRKGFGYLFRSLRLMRRLQAGVWEMLPRLGLSYAYLEIHKLADARKHAARGLELAEAAECKDHIMNALYLLGESEKLLGNELRAYEHFDRLRRDFYPEEPYIANFLMTTDIRQLFHLMA